MEAIIFYIKYIFATLALAWFITKFSPLRAFFDLILPENIKIFALIKKGVLKMVSCPKCCAFWTGLIISHNIWIAIVCSFLMYEYSKSDKIN